MICEHVWVGRLGYSDSSGEKLFAFGVVEVGVGLIRDVLTGEILARSIALCRF